jgi:(p)ppGpp synthase/HD superfamily hydrolase
MKIKLTLQSVEVEADAKVRSMTEVSDASEKELRSLCQQSFSAAEADEIDSTLNFAKSLKSEDPYHPSMQAYLSHPMRVASLTMRTLADPNPALVKLGLVHNVFEVSGLTETDLIERGYEERLAKGVKLLTIDRKRQYDSEYLREFYDSISSFGDDLALIKCLDKLDNLLAFQLFERTPVINDYIELSETFVIPMANRLSIDLGNYLQEVIDYMRSVGCNPVDKLRYQQFLAASA